MPLSDPHPQVSAPRQSPAPEGREEAEAGSQGCRSGVSLDSRDDSPAQKNHMERRKQEGRWKGTEPLISALGSEGQEHKQKSLAAAVVFEKLFKITQKYLLKYFSYRLCSALREPSWQSHQPHDSHCHISHRCQYLGAPAAASLSSGRGPARPGYPAVPGLWCAQRPAMEMQYLPLGAPAACFTRLTPLPDPLSLRPLAGRLPHTVVTAVNSLSSLSSASIYPPGKCYRLQRNAQTSTLVRRSTNLYIMSHFIPCHTSICSIILPFLLLTSSHPHKNSSSLSFCVLT